MKSLTDMLLPVKKALLMVTENVGHYKAVDGTKNHIVYAEDGETSSLAGDNKKILQTIEGTIDLYARDDKEQMFNAVQEALNKEGASFYLNTVTDGGDLKEYIHYEWIFEVS